MKIKTNVLNKEFSPGLEKCKQAHVVEGEAGVRAGVARAKPGNEAHIE